MTSISSSVVMTFRSVWYFLLLNVTVTALMTSTNAGLVKSSKEEGPDKMTPTFFVACVTRPCAMGFGTYPSSSAASSARCLVLGLTPGFPLRASEAVETAIPASLATSLMVGTRVLLSTSRTHRGQQCRYRNVSDWIVHYSGLMAAVDR